MIDSTEARKELEEILNQEEYTVYSKPPGFVEKWWNEAMAWLADLLENWFPSLAQGSRSAAAPLLIVIIAIIVLILAWIAYLLIRNSRRKKLNREYKPLQFSREIDWTYEMHMERAIRLEAEGQLSKAVRHFFLALLLFLHEQKCIEARQWKTNWEYFAELGKSSRADADRFYELASVFDEVTYGERQISNNDYLSFRGKIAAWLEEGRVKQ
ncbi:DUF4129 domain-containing protein [Bacillus sp. FJAT-27245]|uniref:DUF4129 domain-containing protein n=1 Tax=Bacillus sp. FJAT-27245 TaxID=1684144 RepID=UPI0006A76E45|nr:DUF4129 domain-containing protein [Bacillus sp. FJAT-27245]